MSLLGVAIEGLQYGLQLGTIAIMGHPTKTRLFLRRNHMNKEQCGQQAFDQGLEQAWHREFNA